MILDQKSYITIRNHCKYNDNEIKGTKTSSR